MSSVIEVKNLTKKFGTFTAVDDVSFDVHEGEIFGFLGPNGAGKTTTINILCTLANATSGDVHVAGYDVKTQRNEVRRSIGLVFQEPALDLKLTAQENLFLHARLYGVPKPDYEKRLKEVLTLVELWDRRKQNVETYSGGMKRRLEIARGLLHYPRVLFLDEPTLGLDPQTRNHLWTYILKLKREKQMTIFLTTHYMNEAEYADRIGIIDHGKIIRLDTPAKLKANVGGDVITLHVENPTAVVETLRSKLGLEGKTEDKTVRVTVENSNAALPKILQSIPETVSSLEVHKPSLEDVFLQLTGRAIRDIQGSDERIKQSFRGFMGRS